MRRTASTAWTKYPLRYVSRVWSASAASGLPQSKRKTSKPSFEQLLGPGDAGMKVEDGRVADEAEEQHDRRPVARLGPAVTPERGLAERPHLVLRRHADHGGRSAGDELDALARPQLGALDLSLDGTGDIQPREPRQDSSSALPLALGVGHARDEAPAAPVAPPPADVEARGCPRATEGLRGAGPRRRRPSTGPVTARDRAVQPDGWRSGIPTSWSTTAVAGRPAARRRRRPAATLESRSRPPHPALRFGRKERADEAVGEGAPGAHSAVRPG